jgi:hypothetical protein
VIGPDADGHRFHDKRCVAVVLPLAVVAFDDCLSAHSFHSFQQRQQRNP